MSGGEVGPAGLVVVWGNCQAEPLAALLREPLARAGLQVVATPPVYLIDDAQLAVVQEQVSRAAVLVSQPIGDDYRWPALSTAALAERLPAGGRLVTFPVAFHVGAFPFQVHAHGADGARVTAPLTDYHDLRAVVAAARRLTPPEALDWWPAPEPPAVRAVAEASLAEMRRREAGLDVAVSGRLAGPDALWTMTHPTNRVLGEVASDVLGMLGVEGSVHRPAREFLGERRAPLDAAVVRAHGWPATATRESWEVRGEELPALDVVGRHLGLYAARPDVVADTLVRYRSRLETLGLTEA